MAFQRLRLAAFLLLFSQSNAFTSPVQKQCFQTSLKSTESSTSEDELSTMATARFPTSIEDQVRQAAIAIRLATTESETPIHRHSIRLLLPLIGATELDDWPGGAQQQMEAAAPLVQSILKQLPLDAEDRDSLKVQSTIIDPADGVQALFAYHGNPKRDSCSILLPTADTVSKIRELDPQVGPTRDLILVNSEWRRPSDFSSTSNSILPFFKSNNNAGNKATDIEYVESFHPTFVCSNLMVEGDQVRILRAYPSPWRVFLQTMKMNDNDEVKIDWVQIGSKEVTESRQTEEGKLFDYGKPTYQEIMDMITSQEGYVPKSVTERAAAAFTFIKDTL